MPIGVVATVLSGASPAYANPEPPVAWSFYVTQEDTSTGQGRMYTLGCNQAQAANSANYTPMVILDFGAIVDDSGDQVSPFINNYMFQPIEVDQLSEWFLWGYYNCSPQHTIYFAIGTNNSVALDYAKGQQFANTVNVLRGWAAGLSTLMEVWGANDIESWSGTVTPTQAYNWVNGYQAYTQALYIDYGSADNCTLDLTGPCGSTGWGKGDYYNLGWAETNATVTPEVYHDWWAEAWYYISQYGGWTSTGYIYPYGPMDENDRDGSTDTTAQAWSALNTYFPTINYSLQVHAD